MLDSSGTIFQQEGQTLDEVLEELKVEAALPEPEKEEKETPLEPSTKKEPEAETLSSAGEPEKGKEETLNAKDEKDEPFHKRWKEQRDKLERDFQAKLDAQKSEFEEQLRGLKPADSIEKVPDWVKKIYGDSEEGKDFYREFQKEREEERVKIKAEILEEQKKQSEQAKQEQERWTGWVREQLDSLEAEGHRFDRNELQKIALDYMPTDEEGNISFSKALTIYEKLKAVDTQPEKSEARKKLAAATTSKSETEPKPKTYQTQATLRNKSWSALGSGE